MSRAIIQILVACVAISSIYAQLPTADLVDINSTSSLFPQIPGGYNFSLYSGYLQTSNATEAQRLLHYVFVTSQNNPATDPIILWLNGGPGCSSLEGFVYEHGPWVFLANDTKLVWNPYAWNRNASVLYIESPIEVGFSLGPNIPVSDLFTAEENVRATVSFFAKFPTLISNPLFIAGESYGGVYVPSFAQALHFYNQDVTPASLKVNLKGFAVGNGVVLISEQDQQNNFFKFFERHTMISQETVQLYYQYNCPNDWQSLICQTIIEEVANQTQLVTLNPYNIYGYCYNETGDNLPNNTLLKEEYKKNPEKFQKSASYLNYTNPSLNPFNGTPPCADVYGATVIFNDPKWQKALNILQPLPADFLWTMCSTTLNYTEGIDAFTNMSETYNFMLQQGYQVMYFSGDADTVCSIDNAKTFFNNFVDTYDYINTIPKTKWTQPGLYSDEPQFAGYYEAYENFYFVQVAGVGHMVPQWNREGAFKMINSFISGNMNNLD